MADQPQAKRSKWFVLQVVLIGLLTFKLVLAGFLFGRDLLGQVLGPVEVAAQEAKPAPAQKQPAPKKTDQAPAKPGQADQKQAQPQAKPAPTPSPLEVKGQQQLEAERAKLAAERTALEKKRQELTALQTEVAAQMATLEKLRKEFLQQVEAEKQRQNKRIKHLVGLYSNMKPAAAAAVIEKLDEDIAVEIFRQMRGREAGKILANVKPELASKITKRLSERPGAEK